MWTQHPHDDDDQKAPGDLEVLKVRPEYTINSTKARDRANTVAVSYDTLESSLRIISPDASIDLRPVFPKRGCDDSIRDGHCGSTRVCDGSGGHAIWRMKGKKRVEGE